MPVLPVGALASACPFTAQDGCPAIGVGGKCHRAMASMARRFISSGNGSASVPLRRTGLHVADRHATMEAAIAPANADVVSP
jgi:uncharacterized Zn-binding protein involved in type VI secretion